MKIFRTYFFAPVEDHWYMVYWNGPTGIVKPTTGWDQCFCCRGYDYIKTSAQEAY